jgi:hypothetical protein
MQYFSFCNIKDQSFIKRSFLNSFSYSFKNSCSFVEAGQSGTKEKNEKNELIAVLPPDPAAIVAASASLIIQSTIS